MKEPVVLYTLDRLEYSQEILLYKEPKELSLTIWIIVMLFVALFLDKGKNRSVEWKYRLHNASVLLLPYFLLCLIP